MSEPLLLSVEPPLTLSASAKRGLEEARRNVKASHAEEDDVTKLDVLERAWLDERRSIKPGELPLSIRLQKLWAERGDFSRFRASDLLQKTTQDEDDADDDRDSGEKSSDEHLGVNLEGLEDDEQAPSLDESNAQNGTTNEDDAVESAKKEGDVMGIEDMRQLRIRMLESLGMAQNSLFFSHALVSLLINSTKPGVAADGHTTAQHRAGSVASTSGGPVAAHHARAAGANSTSGMQRSALNGAQAAMGSASTLEAELGIEPYIFGASRIEAQRRDVERPSDDGDVGAEDEEDVDDDDHHDDDDDEEEADARKAAARIAKDDAKRLDDEVEEHARDLVERYEAKRSGIQSAISILRKGATTIHPDNEGAGRDRVRWQALMLAKRAGWSLTPDKPIRGTAAKKRELLEDFGGRRVDEPARDAWIGYALPEQSAAYRRRALAYLSHSSTKGDRPVGALLFASREEKRLEVDIVVAGGETWTSGVEDVFSSSEVATTLDGLLRLAQSELVDAELFDTLVYECRALSVAGIAKVTFDDEDCASVEINPFTTLRFKRVSTKAATEEDQAAAIQKNEATSPRHTSALVSCVLTMLRLGLLCRYRERAGLDNGSRRVGSADDKDDDVKAPLLQPLLGLIHYASFVTRIHDLLSALSRRFRHVRFDLDGFERIGDGSEWLQLLLQQPGKTGSMKAVRNLGGSAVLLRRAEPIASMSLAYPSCTSLSLPLKAPSSSADGTGVHLASVDASSLESILTRELERLEEVERWRI